MLLKQIVWRKYPTEILPSNKPFITCIQSNFKFHIITS